MPTYILLSSLTAQGVQTLKSNPDRLREVNRDVEEFGAALTTRAEVGAMPGQVGRQVRGQQRRRRIDAIPREHAGAAQVAAIADRARRVGVQPFGRQRGVLRAVERRGPEHAAMLA